MQVIIFLGRLVASFYKLSGASSMICRHRPSFHTAARRAYTGGASHANEPVAEFQPPVNEVTVYAPSAHPNLEPTTLRKHRGYTYVYGIIFVSVRADLESGRWYSMLIEIHLPLYGTIQHSNVPQIEFKLLYLDARKCRNKRRAQLRIHVPVCWFYWGNWYDFTNPLFILTS